MPYRKLIECQEYIGVDYGEETSSRSDIIYIKSAELPFPDEHFDSIISTQVFEHVVELDTTIRELVRVLKKGGHIFVSVPFVWRYHPHPYDMRRFTAPGIQYELERRGLKVKEIIETGGFFTTMSQLLADYLQEKLFIHRWYNLATIIVNCFVCSIVIAPILATGYILNFLFPDKKFKLPLDIIVVEQKI